VAKVQGFGGVVLQRSPALLLVVFGVPQTLEQLPQRAVQAALALRRLAEGADHAHGPAPRPRGDARLAGAIIGSDGAGGDFALARDGTTG
jgi:hypothetical protein